MTDKERRPSRLILERQIWHQQGLIRRLYGMLTPSQQHQIWEDIPADQTYELVHALPPPPKDIEEAALAGFRKGFFKAMSQEQRQEIHLHHPTSSDVLERFEVNMQFFRRAAGIATIIDYLSRQRGISFGWNDRRVIELGCGDGSGLWTMRTLGARPTGVDLQTHQDAYRKNALVEDIPYDHESSLNFLARQPDNSAEVICAFDTESGVWTPEVSREAYRVLAEDGFIILTWQDVDGNLTNSTGQWPENWPTWHGRQEFFLLGERRGNLVSKDSLKPFTDPVKLAEQRILPNPQLSFDDVTLPETTTMVGTKRGVIRQLKK